MLDLDNYKKPEEPKTICKNCKYYHWNYYLFSLEFECRAIIEKIDIICGNKIYASCEDVNDGNCRFFEKKEE